MEEYENGFDENLNEKYLESLDPEERALIEKIEADKEKIRRLKLEKAGQENERAYLFDVSGCSFEDISALAKKKDIDTETCYRQYLEGSIMLSEIQAIALSHGRKVRPVSQKILDATYDEAVKLSEMQSIPLQDAHIKVLDGHVKTLGLDESGYSDEKEKLDYLMEQYGVSLEDAKIFLKKGLI